MLNIFRTFKLKLLDEHKIKNYFFYAIGEIILVVIGILIALQINNWNQQRVLNEKEVVYIENIKKSLNQDLESIDLVIDFNHKKDSCINRSFNLIGSDENNTEKANEFLELLYTIGYYEVFMPNSIAFDNMIAEESIDLIRDDKLRLGLSSYYSIKHELEFGTQDRIKEKTHQFLDYALPLIISDEIASKLSGQKFVSHYGTNNENEFHKDSGIFYELFMMKQNISDQNRELEKHKSQIIELLNMIELQ